MRRHKVIIMCKSAYKRIRQGRRSPPFSINNRHSVLSTNISAVFSEHLYNDSDRKKIFIRDDQLWNFDNKSENAVHFFFYSAQISKKIPRKKFSKNFKPIHYKL